MVSIAQPIFEFCNIFPTCCRPITIHFYETAIIHPARPHLPINLYLPMWAGNASPHCGSTPTSARSSPPSSLDSVQLYDRFASSGHGSLVLPFHASVVWNSQVLLRPLYGRHVAGNATKVSFSAKSSTFRQIFPIYIRGLVQSYGRFSPLLAEICLTPRARFARSSPSIRIILADDLNGRIKFNEPPASPPTC